MIDRLTQGLDFNAQALLLRSVDDVLVPYRQLQVLNLGTPM